MDVVSECLCYGTTLGLQSVPPEEPCQLAHTIIRWVIPQSHAGFYCFSLPLTNVGPFKWMEVAEEILIPDEFLPLSYRKVALVGSVSDPD